MYVKLDVSGYKCETIQDGNVIIKDSLNLDDSDEDDE